ncbi:putative peptide chain release factor eRF/aRF, subunit 1 [Candidatus Nitrosopumilus salaria BD31]|uniref:Peptide chain release factor subunit 1 n=1 Tax=Candidatus Nitrosopumilus salarius BD31 TaxID=859350 RepID=I3D3Q7_9ARCH|nr:peptide chain release factor aRF-1 [Candidatus Nitrosopumilus salaria]EIJ66350.1 putative peptide chain release factor eRF/aRF, subunit 1 [Candidatus Nitrosopumilus salaria BD31]
MNKKIDVEKQDSVKLYKIRKTLEELSQKSGRGTELISVYIPKGKQLHEIISSLQQEQGTADNIKSDLTRSHVVDSLGKVVQRLKMYKKTPERGLVVFCGALPPEGGGPLGSEVVTVWEIDPPKDLNQYLYRCDDHFHVDILKDMLKDDNLIGFLAIDAKDAGWGLLHGDKIEVLGQTGSGVAGKHRQGGQSAKRFQKLREMELTYYFNRVAETTREYFIDIYPIKGLVISGPGPTKEDFINGNYLEYRLQNMIINTIDASYSGAEGIREAFAKSSDILGDFRMVEEKKLVEDLFREINTNSGKGSYGLQEVIDYLKNNVVKTLIITDNTNLHRVEAKCKRCKHLQEAIVERPEVIPKKTEFTSTPCPSCNAMDTEVFEQDIVDYLEILAAKTGSQLEVISGSAEHGNMLASLGKVGAILRYNPGHAK